MYSNYRMFNFGHVARSLRFIWASQLSFCTTCFLGLMYYRDNLLQVSLVSSFLCRAYVYSYLWYIPSFQFHMKGTIFIGKGFLIDWRYFLILPHVVIFWLTKKRKKVISWFLIFTKKHFLIIRTFCIYLVLGI